MLVETFWAILIKFVGFRRYDEIYRKYFIIFLLPFQNNYFSLSQAVKPFWFVVRDIYAFSIWHDSSLNRIAF